MPAKRCPMCHRASGAGAWQCPCGYEFGQSIDNALELLRDQRTNTRIMLGLLLLVDVGVLGAVVVVGLGGALVFAALGGLFVATGRLIRKLRLTGESIGQLSRRELPKATLRRP
jgi:hypothetical protein